MKNWLSVFLICIVVNVFIMPIRYACSEEPDSVTIDSLIEETLENNPEIQAFYQRYLAAGEVIAQAVSLDDPNLTAGYFVESVETRVGPQNAKYGVSQKFPFFGKLTLRGRIAEKERDIAYQDYKATERQVIKELKYAFYDLYWVRRSITITKEIKQLLETLEKVAESRYSTGIASQQDVFKAQVEISKLIDKLLLLDEQEVTLTERLNTLLNRPVETPIGKIKEFSLTPLNYSVQELFELAKENRQELKAASLNVEKYKSVVSLRKKDYFPDFTLGADFVDVDSGDTSMKNDGQDAWMGMVKINLPIWYGRLKASVKGARDKLTAGEKFYQGVNNYVLFQIKDSYFRLYTCEELVNLYKTVLIPQTEESLKASQASYETGETDFLNLIDSERVLLDYRIAYFRAVANYEKAMADLERAVGKKL